MPWLETETMTERMRFLVAVETGKVCDTLDAKQVHDDGLLPGVVGGSREGQDLCGWD